MSLVINEIFFPHPVWNKFQLYHPFFNGVCNLCNGLVQFIIKSILTKKEGPILIQDYNLMFLEVLDSLKLQDVTLIGHSIGGFFATGFAISHPERVNKLVLLAPLATHINIRRYFRIILKMGEKPGKGPSAKTTLKMQAHPGFGPEPFFVDLMQCVRDYCRIHLLFPYVYSTEELSSIKIPTFLFIGSNEVLCNY